MNQFEYVTVAVSMILALSFARLLGALPHVLAPGRRYWIHALWCCTATWLPIGFWWAIWSYREVEPWTFRAYLSVMLSPAVIYLYAIALVSDDAGSVRSWRDHFFARRRLLFGLLLASTLSIALRQLVVLGDLTVPLAEGLAWNGLAIVALVAVPILGLVTASERVHGVLALVAAAVIAFSFASLAFP